MVTMRMTAAVGGIEPTFDGQVDEHEGSVVMADVLAGLELAESSETQSGGAYQVEMAARRCKTKTVQSTSCTSEQTIQI